MEYRINHLRELEAEAVQVIRETFAQFDKPCILFSGGKDSIVLTHLAHKALHPMNLAFPLVHIDTGHNFEETIAFRDSLADKMNAQLIVGSVEESIKRGTAMEETGANASRNRAQSVTLLETIEHHQFDACMGGGRRDEEKARAKERFFSHRDEFGQWDPKNQRPEIWHIYNGKKAMGEHFRVFPISNWTEMDIWQYILLENIELPSLYFAHTRKVVERHGTFLAASEHLVMREGESIIEKQIRFRTIGDLTITGAVESDADDLEKIIAEVAVMRETERGNRADDKRSEAAMEERKKEGYF